LGFVWIRSACRPVKWVFDPFLDERDRIVTTTHGLGGPCYGLEKNRGASWASSVVDAQAVSATMALAIVRRKGVIGCLLLFLNEESLVNF
jgi:hypothetical protein